MSKPSACAAPVGLLWTAIRSRTRSNSSVPTAARDEKNARRERTQYHFTDGFLQDLQGEVTQCHSCKRSLRVVPVVMLHDQDEQRRFEAVFSDLLLTAKN